METKQITENNKLIAKFMNYANGRHLTDDLLKTLYNDWNSLMPVVEKIESIDFIVLIRQGHTSIVNNSGKETFYSSSDFVEKTKIEALYNIVIEFIKWYNVKKSI